MDNQIRLNDIADNLLIFDKKTVEALFKLENCADCIALYSFYYKTAKWQKTNTIKAVDNYVKMSLKWGSDKIKRTKQTLKEHGLISIVQRRKDGKIDGWYIEVSYLVAQKKTEEINIKVEDIKNTQNQEVENSTSGLEETNALKEKIKCLEKEIEMLKNKKKSCSRFSPPSIEEVQAYCLQRNNSVNPEGFVDFYASKGWKVGNTPMKDWKACVRTWEQRNNGKKKPQLSAQEQEFIKELQDDVERF